MMHHMCRDNKIECRNIQFFHKGSNFVLFVIRKAFECFKVLNLHSTWTGVSRFLIYALMKRIRTNLYIGMSATSA